MLLILLIRSGNMKKIKISLFNFHTLFYISMDRKYAKTFPEWWHIWGEKKLVSPLPIKSMFNQFVP